MDVIRGSGCGTIVQVPAAAKVLLRAVMARFVNRSHASVGEKADHEFAATFRAITLHQKHICASRKKSVMIFGMGMGGEVGVGWGMCLQYAPPESFLWEREETTV